MYIQIPIYGLNNKELMELSDESVRGMFNDGKLHAYILSETKPLELEGFKIFKLGARLSDRTRGKHGVNPRALTTGTTKILDLVLESNKE